MSAGEPTAPLHARPLTDLTAWGRVAFLPSRLLVPGQALLAPFAQITRVLAPAHAQGGVMVLTAHNPRWYHFTPEAWAFALDPFDMSSPCPGCARDWLEGCAEQCNERVVFDEDAAEALAAAGLAAGWSVEQILAARP
jgi:hypothetical protein